jgi:hypothetical protein
MYFNMKNTLKNNRNHTPKQSWLRELIGLIMKKNLNEKNLIFYIYKKTMLF